MKKCPTCGELYSGDLCPRCPDAPPLKPGQTFHGLEIVDLLGRGGMGVVYRARQPALDRSVALKILPRKLALDPDFQGRFAREAKALGSLSHPNIVAIHDFGAEEGLFFFAMEFVDGVNLRQLLREGKLPPEQAFRIVPQLCDALDYAHGEGVVHRDIKPENILLDKRGRVKIADFGLAKLTGAEASLGLTQTHMVMGTPHYMAPEQIENPKSVDHRADIYSMGVVFYEMLTGELPIGRFEPPSKKVTVDVRLDEVVLKALEKAPERRYQTAAAVKEDMTRVTSIAPTVITPPPGKKSRMPLILACVVLGLLSIPLAQIIAPLFDPVAKPPRPPAAVDFTKLYFTPEERPGGRVLLNRGATILRNPYPMKEPADFDWLVKYFDTIGFPNISRTDLREAYFVAWYGCAITVMDSPIAERLEREFTALADPKHRWSHRRGSLLVLAYAFRRDDRAVFADLVRLIQKKTGLPETSPDLPIEHVKPDRSDGPVGWIFTERPDGVDFRRKPNRKDIDLTLLDAPHAMPVPIDATRYEVLRAARTVAILTLYSDQILAYEKLAQKIRPWMGYPERAFETIWPTAAELPAGFAFDAETTETTAILEGLGVTDVPLADVKRGRRAKLKPHGAITLLETADSNVRSKLEDQLNKRGAADDTDSWVYAVEGPDAATLGALETLMRAKFGWDAKPK